MDKIKFSKDFIFGVATSAYQIEGNRENLDSCIWDDFAKLPGKVVNHEDGKVACDHFNRVEEDVKLLRKLNLRYYRFSINWTRVFKNGIEEVNEEGLMFYKKLIKLLKENDIVPVVTLYHWDLPSVLQEKGGWANDESVQWFVKYSEVIFKAFGNDVGYYSTINEPFCATYLGYLNGVHAPGIESIPQFLKASKNILLAHGEAVKLYRSLGYVGKIGICLNIADVRPVDDEAKKNIKLVEELKYFWYFNPLFNMGFPQAAISYYKERGYEFNVTQEELDTISTKCDFLGINHYNPEYYDKDMNQVDVKEFPHNSLNWIVDSTSLSNVIRKVHNLTPIDILILENGYCTNYGSKEEEVNDDDRVKFYHDSLVEIKKCIEEGINVKGFFAWSLFDNFEWAEGYSHRFGLVYVDYNTQERIIKNSGYYISEISKETYDRKLIFEDDFSSLDKWNVSVAGGGFGNDENQYYLAENISLENGLKITGKKEKYEKYQYTSGKIVSKQEFQYGRFEFIAKIPTGCGAWPAIWMLPTNKQKLRWPSCGEIDIMEEVGRNPNVIHFSLHSKSYNHILKTQRTGFYKVDNIGSEFKKYSMEWNEDYIEFFIDNVSYIRFNKNDPKYKDTGENWPFDKPYNLIINLAIGGYWGRPIKDEDLPFYFEVKSVKIYR